MTDRIYLASPHMIDEGYGQKYVQKTFDTNWIAPLGKNVNEFENELAHKVQIKAAAALVSGTSTIHLHLKLLVLVKKILFFVQALHSQQVLIQLYIRMLLQFLLIVIMKPGICVLKIEAFNKYTPKAVIVVHLYGLSANLDPSYFRTL